MALFDSRIKIYCTNCGFEHRVNADDVEFYPSRTGSKSHTTREPMMCPQCRREVPFSKREKAGKQAQEDFAAGKNRPKKKGLFF